MAQGSKDQRLIHELDTVGRHRIVHILDNGMCDVSEWFPIEQVASLYLLKGDTLYAIAQHPVLPTGIFRTRDVQHSILT